METNKDPIVDKRVPLARPVPESPVLETIRVRKVNPTVLTREDGSIFATGEVAATPAEVERWSRLNLVVKV